MSSANGTGHMTLVASPEPDEGGRHIDAQAARRAAADLLLAFGADLTDAACARRHGAWSTPMPVERYEEVIEAYLRGLERRIAAGEPVAISSVASFFVSRIDAKADAALAPDSASSKDYGHADAKSIEGRPCPADGATKTREVLMSVTTPPALTSHDRVASPNGGNVGARTEWRDPRYQAFALMRLAFTAAPIAFGLDKFFNVMVDWPIYLAPWINDIAPGTGQEFMYFVGATEILAGIIVALKPRYGAYVVAGWLGGIVINLLIYSDFYDIALRDFGLMLGALTLARLAAVYDPPLRLGRR